jgi:Asp-tRNA(Asn)/Glu-tRNA(Gln) amidotransferase A subunit family amidase
MVAAIESAGRAAEAAGARVTAITLPQLCADAFTAHGTIQDYEAYLSLAWEYDNHRDRLGPLLRDLLDRGARTTPEAYDKARRIARHARRALGDLLQEVDVIVTPAAPGAAPHGLDTTGVSTFNRLWTLMGTPCVNVPGIDDAGGLPLGVQVVGRFGADRETLAAARFVEQAIAAQQR